MISQPSAPIFFADPIVVFGGPYSNLQALDALIDEAARRGVPPSRMISTGDLVAYCADARGVVARIRETGVRFIRGNCEDQVAAGAEDCGCGFLPGGQCDRLSADWFAHALRELDEDDRAFLGHAPARLDIVINGVTLAVVHGAATQTNRFVFASTPARVKAHDLDLLGVDGVIAGHSGLPFTQQIDGRLWHNAGAVGMPANDGTPRVWFSVLRPGDSPRTLEIQHCALDYDFLGAADAMARAGLAEDYARTLVDGLWPNCDALPPVEAAEQGRAIATGAIRFAAGVPAPTAVPAPKPQEVRPSAPSVPLVALETLWVNTGSLCNLACDCCYMQSSPRNDRLAYMTAADAATLFDEIERENLPTRTIGFTGGEPFLNPDLPTMLADALDRGFSTQVLTNAMKPMRRRADELMRLKEEYGARLALRVSLDHYTRELHELERGRRSFEPTAQGLAWLARAGFQLSVAGRLFSGESESIARGGFARLFAELGVPLDALSPDDLVLFPEMGGDAVQPVTEESLSLLDMSGGDLMCATGRMAVKRKGATGLSIVACTLLPYDPAFELGSTLKAAGGAVAIDHPNCATFCVFGGAKCSA